MTPQTCPGCSGSIGPLINHKTIQLHPATRIGECQGCGGLVGTIDVRDLYLFVFLDFEVEPYDAEEARYFDLDVISPISADRNYRTHGWYLPRTKHVVQFG